MSITKTIIAVISLFSLNIVLANESWSPEVGINYDVATDGFKVQSSYQSKPKAKPKLNPNIISGLTQQAVRAHNQVRRQVGQKPLVASLDLQKISQQWSNQLARSCTMYHHKGEIPFNENLHKSTGPTNVTKVVNDWAVEKQNYNYKNNTCPAGKKCYHYTQIVWKGTTDLGCAMQRCSNGSEIYVCSYFPPGNIIGARPY